MRETVHDGGSCYPPERPPEAPRRLPREWTQGMLFEVDEASVEPSRQDSVWNDSWMVLGAESAVNDDYS